MIIVVVFNFRWHAQYSVRIEWSCWLAISHRTHEKHLAEQIFSLHSVLYLFFVCFKFLIESIGKSLNSDSLRIIKSIIVRNLKFYRKCKILLLVELRIERKYSCHSCWRAENSLVENLNFWQIYDFPSGMQTTQTSDILSRQLSLSHPSNKTI